MSAPAPCDRCGRVECPLPAAQLAVVAASDAKDFAAFLGACDARSEAVTDCDGYRARLPALYATERAARLDAERRVEGLAGLARSLSDARVALVCHEAECPDCLLGLEDEPRTYCADRRLLAAAYDSVVDALTAHAAKACRCGAPADSDPHPCHGGAYTCRKPARRRLYVPTTATGLAGMQAKASAAETWACDDCWAARAANGE